MTERIRLDDLTSDQLDQLYDRAERAEAELLAVRAVADADSKQLAEVDDRCDHYAAAITRVHALVDECEARGQSSGHPLTVTSIREALDQPAGPAATETAEHVYLSTGCFHGEHDYCKAMTGLNGTKRPGECKHCGAKCQCGCHTAALDKPTP